MVLQHMGLVTGDIGDQVWQKTLQEVETGALVGPIPLDQVPPEYPLSRRFGIRRGARVRCIDDFSRSSVNSSVQSCESPKSHTLDVFAALCVRLISQEIWRARQTNWSLFSTREYHGVICFKVSKAIVATRICFATG